MALFCQNGHENVDGAFFCEECGIALTSAQTSSARLCPQCGAPNGPEATACAQCGTPLAETTSASLTAGQARLVLVANGIIFDLSDRQEAIIGRSDVTSDMFPDIDLGPYGAEEAGISRHHAHWRRERERFTIEDMASTNFTFLNKQRLDPNVPTTLKFGDEVRLGRIVLRFEGE